VAIPNFQSCMLPVLRLASDEKEHTLAEAREALAAEFHLSPEDRAELLPSGRQRRFDNRVAWAKVYLDHAGLLRSPRRGRFQITKRGHTVLHDNLSHIDIPFLEQFEEFRAFQRAADKPEPGAVQSATTEAVVPEYSYHMRGTSVEVSGSLPLGPIIRLRGSWPPPSLLSTS
jgi:restriction system protein